MAHQPDFGSFEIGEMEPLRDNVGGLGTPASWVRQDSQARFLPAIAAGAYPFLLRAFHVLVGPPSTAPSAAQIASAGAVLALIVCIPILGIICEARPTQSASTRRLAYAESRRQPSTSSWGVLQGIMGSPLPDEAV